MIRQQAHILAQPMRRRTPPQAPWEYGFSRYLGRALTPAERAVIRPIERARRKGVSRPVLVIDPPGTDSTKLLRKYQEYYLGLCPEYYGILIHPSGHRPEKNRRIHTFSGRNVYGPRGLSADCILMLNVEQYKSSSPFFGRHGYNYRWDELYCSLYPQLCGNGIFIVHTVAPEGRKLKKYQHWLSNLTYLLHLRAEAAKIANCELRIANCPIVIPLDAPPQTPPIADSSLLISSNTSIKR